MRSTLIFSCLFIIFLITVCSECDHFPGDSRYRLFLKNNAQYAVCYYLAFGDGYATTAYPDTSLPENNVFIHEVIKPNEKSIIYDSGLSWQECFKLLPADTLSVFIFNTDTLNIYPWEEIRANYKILKRYDLSYHDLKQMNWTVSYP